MEAGPAPNMADPANPASRKGKILDPARNYTDTVRYY